MSLAESDSSGILIISVRAHSICFFLRNAKVDNEINESCQCTAFIHHNQFLDPKDTDIQKRDRFQKIIMISNGSYLQNILSINDRAHELPSLDGLTDTAEVSLMPVNGDELSIPKRNNICNTSFVLRIVCLARAIRTLLQWMHMHLMHQLLGT